MKRARCSRARQINLEIQKKIRGALADVKKRHPKAAGVKLNRAGFEIYEQTKGIWEPAETLRWGNDACWVSHQLMDPAKMRSPKWKARIEEMLEAMDRAIARTDAFCK